MPVCNSDAKETLNHFLMECHGHSGITESHEVKEQDKVPAGSVEGAVTTRCEEGRVPKAPCRYKGETVHFIREPQYKGESLPS